MILSTQFLTPRHLLCLKSRSVELLTLDFLQEVHDSSVPETSQTLAGHALYSRGQRQPPLIQHELPNKSMNLRGAVFSLPKIVHQQDGVSSIGVTFLAYDVLRGLFHYSVETRFSSWGWSCISSALLYHRTRISGHTRSDISRILLI